MAITATVTNPVDRMKVDLMEDLAVLYGMGVRNPQEPEPEKARALAMQVGRFILCLLLIGVAWSVELPREAQREIEAFESGVAKLDAERQAKLNALVDKAVKALNAASLKAKTVEERRAIDDEIIKISKQKTEADVLGDKKEKNPWVGRYKWWRGQLFDIKSDGTTSAVDGDPGRNGKWIVEMGKLKITWPSGGHDLLEPPDKSGSVSVVNDKGEKFIFTKVEETK